MLCCGLPKAVLHDLAFPICNVLRDRIITAAISSKCLKLRYGVIMLNLEIAIAKIRQLPPEQQQQVFQFVESLEKKANFPNQTPEEEIIEGITQGLKEAFNDKTLPLSQMWEGIDAD